MPKINNSSVVQKLIDELDLSPGVDTIPTELAEKVLAVYQVNDQAVTMAVAPSTIVRNSANQTTDSIMYTTPSTGRFFLTAIDIDAWGTNDLTYDGLCYIEITPIDDSSARGILRLGFDAGTADSEAIKHASLSFPNPIELEPGSTVTLKVTSNGNLKSSGSMVGYTTE